MNLRLGVNKIHILLAGRHGHRAAASSGERGTRLPSIFRLVAVGLPLALIGFAFDYLETQAADPQSQQIERAQVLRDIDATVVRGAAHPPASIEDKELASKWKQAGALAADQRWRSLLGAQRRETHIDSPVEMGARLRSAQARRQQQADEVHRRIESDALRYRLQLR